MAAALFLLLSLSLNAAQSPATPTDLVAGDAAALLALKRSVSLDPSDLLSCWNPTSADTNHCHWRGVACDPSSGWVTALNLTGTQSSRIAGTIPDAIGVLTELRSLSFRSNAFSGEIPAAIGRLKQQEALDLRGNNFSGPIPEGLVGMWRLESVDLSFNQLSGEIKISSLTPCKSLTRLKLSDNFLVNNIPPEIGNCSGLRTLLVNGNILEGRIPAEVGQIYGLQVLDVSRNSLTDRIPRELGNCSELSVLVLTNLEPESSTSGEFIAFVGAIPPEILLIPSLEILWAPRANVEGHLPDRRNGLCSLRMLNLGQNYIRGKIPGWLGLCSNLTFLDLSSNDLQGSVPLQLGIQCMFHVNVSHNLLFGYHLGISETGCKQGLISDGLHGALPQEKDRVIIYSEFLLRSVQINSLIGSVLGANNVVLHDFSWNNFVGPLPSFSFPFDKNFSYGLFLNNNGFNVSLSAEFFTSCKATGGLAVNLSVNRISGEIGFLRSCPQLMSFEAASNLLSGLIPLDIGNLSLLSRLDLRGNYLNGSVPYQLGALKSMQQVLLGGNNLSGKIPVQLGGMAAIRVMDLSRNSLTGIIPSTLANAASLEALLLDHNRLSGEIPPSFGTLPGLLELDVSYNNLSGVIPHLKHSSGCEFFRGKYFLQPCPDTNTASAVAEGANHSLKSQE